MVPVQGVAVPGRVLLALPRAEVRQEVVDVVRAVQVRRVLVQDLEALEDELDPVAESVVVVEELYLVEGEGGGALGRLLRENFTLEMEEIYFKKVQTERHEKDKYN